MPPNKAASELEKIEPKPLGFEENRLKLNVVKENRGLLKEALPRGAVVAPRRIVVSIEGLSADFPPDFVYRVFVNLPERERSESVLRQHYVGSINFFGRLGPIAEPLVASMNRRASSRRPLMQLA